MAPLKLILMETRQGTVDIVTGILCTQMDRLVQISFSLFYTFPAGDVQWLLPPIRPGHNGPYQ